MSGLKDEIKRLDGKSANVDARINALSDDINSKFDMLFKALNVNPINGAPISSPPALNRAKTMRPGTLIFKVLLMRSLW